MGLLLGSLRKRSGEDSVENQGAGALIKTSQNACGSLLFSRRNNRIWYFTYREQWSCLSMNPEQEIERRTLRGSCTTLCHYDCRPEENERPSKAATRKGFLSGWQQHDLKWSGLKLEWNDFWVNVSFPSHSKDTLLSSCTAVTLTAARTFVRVMNVGNRHYHHLQENEIIHICW